MAKRQRRKRQEEFLDIDERDLADFFDNAPIGLHWVGPDGYILKVNQAELDLLGYSREEYVGHHISEFHADPTVSVDILQRLEKHETLLNYEARLRCKDGSIKHVLITSNVCWKNGQFVHTRCFTQDITVRKQAEDALRTKEERYRLATRATRDVIWDWDMVSDEVVWGEALSEVFGYSTDQVPCIIEDARQWWIGHIHPEDVERVHASYQAFRQSAADIMSTEYRFRRADGSYAMVFDRAFLVRSATGTSVRMTGAMSDITARQQADEKLRLRTRQMAALAAIAHALAAPEAFEEKASKMIEEMRSLAQGDFAVLRVASEAEQGLRCVATSLTGRVEGVLIPLLRPGQALDNLAYERGEPVIANEYATHPCAIPAIVAQGVQSVAVFPLKVGGRVLGTVGLSCVQKDHFTPDRSTDRNHWL